MRIWLLSASIVLATSLFAPAAGAQMPAPLTPEISAKLKVLDVFSGTWDVTVRTRLPKPAVVTYTETYTWALDRRFLHGDSGRKSDGTQDLVMATYDQPSGGYPFWIFSSSGAWTYLAPGQWDATSRTMVWKNPPNIPITYLSRCEFPDAKSRRCSTFVKNWTGAVLLDQEASAVRRR
ncbi:MAG: hypothetical protein ABI433_03455 [Burkholderiaceae bacterium]